MSSYRRSHNYGDQQLRVFFRAIDKHLTSAASLVIIGGAAAVFHDARSTTNDVDTYEPIGPNLRLAIEHAMAETGLSIPTHHSAVADVPYHFEDRLERRLRDLANLRILVLEKHDLALSKTIRGDEHDEQQIESIHRSVGLDFELLVQRFRDEMTTSWVILGGSVSSFFS